jgi:lysophospholipase L1-like esterase
MSAMVVSSMRSGLGHVGATLRAGGPMTVAYLGGSITWGGNASDIERFSYRARTTAWLREQYPASTIREINAGVGGTGSDMGAFRLRHDVLQHDPDLVFVEFAVNDSGGQDERTASAFEGIIRHIRRDKPRSDICIVYTLAQGHLTDYAAGRLPRTVVLHERVAERYEVPSINMALDVARRIEAGNVSWETFSGDTCHPTDAGFAIFTSTITAAMPEMLQAAPRSTASVLPQPLSQDPWDNADLLPLNGTHAAEGWTYRPMQHNGGWDCFHGLLESDHAGATLDLPFDGRMVGVLYQLGPDSGHMDVAVDDGQFKTLQVFDRYAVGMSRPQHRMVDKDLAPGRHTLRVRVTGDRAEQSKGNYVRLGYLMVR